MWQARWYCYSAKSGKIASAGAIYLAGSALILALDAFFPFDSLGPLQIVVPIYLQIDQAIINFVDTSIINVGPQTPNSSAEPALATGNLLVMNGLHGPFALQVFWPSRCPQHDNLYTCHAGDANQDGYAINQEADLLYSGTLGTVATNLVRIVSLSLYALVVTTDVGVGGISFHCWRDNVSALAWHIPW